MKDKYSMVEGWVELGNLEEAELEFQKLSARDLATTRGLKVWIRFSRAMGRWQEVESAAAQLRDQQPRNTFAILSGAEALYHQERTMEAVALLAANAVCFTGSDWSAYLELLKHYVAQAGLPDAQRAKFDAILKAEGARRQLATLSVTIKSEVEVS